MAGTGRRSIEDRKARMDAIVRMINDRGSSIERKRLVSWICFTFGVSKKSAEEYIEVITDCGFISDDGMVVTKILN